MSQLAVYLMRGLPACGKSFTARQLAGSEGVVLETDQFFYMQVGDDPEHFDFSESLLPAARDWVFEQFRQALQDRRSPVVLDRGNGLNPETRRFAAYAVERGYQVELREPDSPWWQELRVLLKYKKFLDPALFDQWSQRLAEKSRTGHRVPAATIRRWIDHWQSDLTVDRILACASTQRVFGERQSLKAVGWLRPRRRGWRRGLHRPPPSALQQFGLMLASLVQLLHAVTRSLPVQARAHLPCRVPWFNCYPVANCLCTGSLALRQGIDCA